MAKKATAMHENSPDAGGFGNPAYMLPPSTKDIESKPVEDSANTGIELGPVQTEFPGRKLGE